jgi:methionyl aminopeptidase
MIFIKTSSEIKTIGEGGSILSRILRTIKREVRPGNTTNSLDELARKLVLSYGARAAFLGYAPAGNGRKYPAALCVSINDEVVHGLPGGRIIREGDVVSLDMGVEFKRLYSDGAVTVIAGKSKDERADQLLDVTERSLYAGIDAAREGNHVGDISHAVQTVAEGAGFAVVRDLVGHGVGREIHEEPQIPNFGVAGRQEELKAGMVIAIEPMLTAGSYKVILDNDGWTYRTADGSLAAHFEHTVAITKKGPKILTK